MKRTDIVMTEELKSFLAFDLGHMKEDAFPNKRTDIPYCDDPELLMDIYYPEEKKDTYPVFLIVFGGGWISGFRRSRFVEYMHKPLQMGYACAIAVLLFLMMLGFNALVQKILRRVGGD